MVARAWAADAFYRACKAEGQHDTGRGLDRGTSRLRGHDRRGLLCRPTATLIQYKRHSITPAIPSGVKK